jgi:pyruvate kinase
VTAAKDDELQAVVVNGGVLGAHKGINAPGIALPASAVTDKDADDLRFGLQLGVDLVALSFVQTADDIRRACEIMNEVGRLVPVIAKIERPAAVENLDGILQAAEGVMVARGDLGLEMPLEQLPRIQRTILARARSAGRPVILATQVLESMRSEPRPTRAEVSDAANAVLEGADAIMLAGETAVGAFSTRAVQTLDAIIRDARSSIPPSGFTAARSAQHPGIGDPGDHRSGQRDRGGHEGRKNGAVAVVAATAGADSRRHPRARKPPAGWPCAGASPRSSARSGTWPGCVRSCCAGGW